MTNDTLRVGFVGLGGVCGQVHYPGFSGIPGVEITGLCDPDADLLAKRKAEWDIKAAYKDVRQFFREVNPDAVAIAVPNIYHRELVLQAIESGCHVLCEKPLGMTVPETVEMYDAGRSAGVRHMTAFTYRFVPGLTYIKSLVDAGALGEIRHARFQRLQDWGETSIGWRQYKTAAGTGELGDMGIHRIDFAEDLLGPIHSVCGAMKRIVSRDHTKDGKACEPQDVEDWVAWISEFESGATGVFEMGKLTKGRGPDGGHDLCEINGSEASVVYQLHTPHAILIAPQGQPYTRRTVPDEFLKRPGSPRNPNRGDPVETFRYDQAWEFVSAIREGRECLPSFYHGMRAQVVAESIVEAATTRRWVNVPQWTKGKK